jgi:hypothetical protein
MQRSVNYESDNLTFADFYGFFTVSSLVLAALVVAVSPEHLLFRKKSG